MSAGRYLAAGHPVVQGIRLAWWPAVRNLAQGFHDLQRNDVARRAGSAFEQIRHRGADLCLSVVVVRKIPIETSDMTKVPFGSQTRPSWLWVRIPITCPALAWFKP